MADRGSHSDPVDVRIRALRARVGQSLATAAHFEEARQWAASLPDPERSDALAGIGAVAALSGIADPATLVEGIDPTALSERGRLWAEHGRAAELFRAGDMPGAADAAPAVVEAAAALPATAEQRLDAELFAGRALVSLPERFGEGDRLLADVARRARAASLTEHETAATFVRAVGSHYAGRWAAAEEMLATVVASAEGAGGPNPMQVDACRYLIRMAGDRSEQLRVERMVRRLRRWPSGDRLWAADVGGARLLAGDVDAGLPDLLVVAADPTASVSARVRAVGLVALALVDLDDQALAPVAEAGAELLDPEAAESAHVRQLVGAVVRRELDGVDRALADVVRIAPPVVVADALQLAAAVAERVGDAEAAEPYLVGARERWLACGATGRVRMIDRARLRMGLTAEQPTVGPRPPEGWASLTPAEHRVMVLVAEGHPYQEVADELFLSRRTVETHVARIRRKVGARNRAELVASYLREADTA